MLKWVLRHQVFMLVVAVLTLVATIWLYCDGPQRLLSAAGYRRLDGHHRSRPGHFVSGHDSHFTREVLAIVMADPAVESIGSFVSGSGNSTVNNGRMFITLKPVEERNVTR